MTVAGRPSEAVVGWPRCLLRHGIPLDSEKATTIGDFQRTCGRAKPGTIVAYRDLSDFSERPFSVFAAPSRNLHILILIPSCSATKKRTITNPQRGNRDFTDSEDDTGRASSSNPSSPKRETRSSRGGGTTDLVTGAEKSLGDEVDELDDDDDVRSPEEPRRQPKMLPPAPTLPSSRYQSYSMNGVSVPDESTHKSTRQTDVAVSEDRDEPDGSESEDDARQPALSPSSGEETLDRHPSTHRNRASEGFRNSAASGGGLDRFMAGHGSESPFAGSKKGKRKGTVGVMEGEVEGEVSADVGVAAVGANIWVADPRARGGRPATEQSQKEQAFVTA